MSAPHERIAVLMEDVYLETFFEPDWVLHILAVRSGLTWISITGNGWVGPAGPTTLPPRPAVLISLDFNLWRFIREDQNTEESGAPCLLKKTPRNDIARSELWLQLSKALHCREFRTLLTVNLRRMSKCTNKIIRLIHSFIYPGPSQNISSSSMVEYRTNVALRFYGRHYLPNHLPEYCRPVVEHSV
jgi:hypothetical protein